MHGLWEIWQGLIGLGCMAFLFYQLAIDAVEDRNARAMLVATIAALAVVGGFGLLWRRNRAGRAG